MTLSSILSHKRGIAACLGAAMALAFAPLFLAPIALFSLAFFALLLTREPTLKGKIGLAICFGMMMQMASLYWIGFAISTEADRLWWFIVPSVLGMAILMLPYTLLPTVIFHYVRGNLALKWLGFSVAWLLGEYARSYVITFVTLYGFPWNFLGYIWADNVAMMQLASWCGVYGLSAFTLLLVYAMAEMLHHPSKTYRSLCLVGSVMLLLTVWGYGQLRLSSGEPIANTNTRLRLVQANISEHHSWDPVEQQRMLQTHITLSQQGAESQKLDAVIWSESSAPELIEEKITLRQLIATAAPKAGGVVTGAMRVDRAYQRLTGTPKLYSTLHIIDDQAHILGVYDKVRLVPMGEYNPIRSWFPLDTLVGGVDFSEGAGPKTLVTEMLPPVSPLICYDVIFPQSVVDEQQRPEWMLNITNDMWFEWRLHLDAAHPKDFIQMSSGPYQHFAMARMRTVEQGLPLVRVANTGMSAQIDAYGRMVDQIPLGEQGVRDISLTSALAPTYYAQHGDKPLMTVMVIAALLVCLLSLYQRKRNIN